MNQDKIRTSLEELQDLYQRAPCGYHSIDGDGLIIEINETELDWLGYNREEVVGRMKASDLLTANSLEIFLKLFPNFKKEGNIHGIQVEFVRKNKSILPVLLSAGAVYDEDGNYLFSRTTVFDITELKRAEKRIEESDARLLAFLGNVPAVIFAKDLEGRYLFVNDEFLRTFRKSRGEVLFRKDREIFPAEQANLFIKNDERVLETGERIEFEEVALYADGEHTSIVNKFPIRDDDGDIVALGGIATDITERKKIDNALLKVHRALLVLSQCNEVIIHAENETELYEKICNIIVDRGGYRMAWIGFVEKDEEKTIRPIALKGTEEGYLNLAKVTWSDSPHGMGPTGMAVKTGLCQINRDFLTNPVMKPWKAEALRRGYKSSVALPLKDSAGTFGVLSIYSADTEAFDEDEINFLKDLSADLSFGINALRVRAEHKKAEEAIHRLAYFDTLTGLPNKIFLLERLEKSMSSLSPGSSVSLLTLDIERFNEIQDGLGVRQADNLLRKISTRLADAAKEQFIARIETDRFAVLLEAAPPVAKEMAKQLLLSLADPIEQADIFIDVRASIGCAVFPDHGRDPDALILRSDIAARQAKQSGENFMLYSGATDQESPRRLKLIGDLKRGIQSGQMLLHYQPKVDLRTKEVSGVEALIRWADPQRGLVMPSEFIHLAEHTGLIRPLTEWVVDTAFSDITEWKKKGIEIPVAVNVSPRSLRDPELLEKVISLQEKHQVDSGLLQIEITETSLIEDPARSHDILSTFKEKGFKVFIDDFGTGYSSLSYIATLPIHALKIDRSFIVRMTEKAEHRAVVQAAVSLAHSLGLRVIAEGVEAVSQLEELERLGCDEIQGYYFSKPLPVGDFLNWFASCKA